MDALIIAKPVLINLGKVGELIKEIEETGAIINGIKTMLIDIHKIDVHINEEKESEKKAKLLGAKKVPAVLIVISSKCAEKLSNDIKKKYSEKVHTSLNPEIAKYEIQRFFSEDEIFSYGKTEGELFWGKESKEWKKYAKKSVLEIEKEIKEKNILKA
ncbi:MAG: hypothetical protein NTY48_06030 [Candidatus Diapherotrites archaeon]|nr:hypothetical protein [Candidatus Diapherotrites archaeon]